MWYHAVNNFHGRDENIPSVAQCKRNTAGGNSALSYCHHVQQAFLRTEVYGASRVPEAMW